MGLVRGGYNAQSNIISTTVGITTVIFICSRVTQTVGANHSVTIRINAELASRRVYCTYVSMRTHTVNKKIRRFQNGRRTGKKLTRTNDSERKKKKLKRINIGSSHTMHGTI